MMQQILTKVITNLFQTDPALVSTVIDAITKSGSNVPLIGVTNGQAAQPGQVGEWVQLQQTVPYPITSQVAYPVSLGVLQPGDWDCFMFAEVSTWVSNLQVSLSPMPAGFSNPMAALIAAPSDIEAVAVVTPVAQALISTPTLIAIVLTTNNVGNGNGAGNAIITFNARRAR